ncbi:MAG TPA: hypothetical protein VJS11_12340 [Acidobacteriaceae bacterium]|nr:hypothetical protein [Acidobacteriaceae bacterium]
MEVLTASDVKARKELVERVAASPLLNRSTRLRDLLLYVCGRVLDEGAQEIHELEVGHRVFGRDAHYDTIADNIVRVHASMLRKRLNEYFEREGRDEPVIIEIPRGNYAPLFVERPPNHRRAEPRPEQSAALETLAASVWPDPLAAPVALPTTVPQSPQPRWALPIAITLALLFCGLSLYLLWTAGFTLRPSSATVPISPDVRQFWSGIFLPSGSATVVLDDASLDFYQQATGQTIPLGTYFDRSYLTSAEKSTAASRLDPALAYSLMLRRQSSFAYSSLVWNMAQIAADLHASATVQFARDLNFRQVKSGNVVLLGNPQSNPWIQAFDPRVSIGWLFDPQNQIYYPYDKQAPSTQRDQFRAAGDDSHPRIGYATISYLPNLSGSGNALLLTATGGSAMGVAMDFLNDQQSMNTLLERLHAGHAARFPYFEALLKTARGSKELNSVQILLCRPAGAPPVRAQ